MAVNMDTFKYRIGGGAPLRMLLPVAAGSSQAIKRGEICYNNSGTFTVITGDTDYAGDLVVCDDEVKSTDSAGYRYFIVPDSLDVFEYELSAAAAITRGTAIGYSTTQKVASGVSNPFAKVLDHSGYPKEQGHADVGDVADRGTSVATTQRVQFVFERSESYISTLIPLSGV